MENKEEKESLWIELPQTEKKNYLEFHQQAYLEDLQHAEENMLKYPRWSIISGYYAMHDLTKLFFALNYNFKITSPQIHLKVILVLEEKIKDETIKKKLIDLLKEAKEEYFQVERLKEKVIPLLLKEAKKERGKAQYYTEDFSQERKTTPQRAAYFLDNFVKPYIQILEGLIKNAS